MPSGSSPTTASRPYALAIHTSTPDLGLELSNFAGDRRHQVWELGRSLSTDFHQYLLDFLAPQTWSDLGWIAVAKGPGGFTGTRIGVVTARTLAQQLDVPLFAVSTLAAIAWLKKAPGDLETHLAVQMPAQRGELFVAIYQVSPQGLNPLLVDCVLTPEVWQKELEQWSAPYQLITASSHLGDSVTGILELAQLSWQQGERPHWSAVLPFYGQHPVKS